MLILVGGERVKSIFRGIFIGGCTVLLLICVAGFWGIIEVPTEYYFYFWVGFFTLFGIAYFIGDMVIRLAIWAWFINIFRNR